MPNSNLEQLNRAARLLRPILNDLVFVGGSVTGLLISDNAAREPRFTRDVDAIAQIDSYAAYAALEERLRSLGLKELDENILGFSNRWYRVAIDNSVTRRRVYIRDEIKGLLARSRFLDALPGLVFPDETSQSRIRIILRRLQEIANVPL